MKFDISGFPIDAEARFFVQQNSIPSKCPNCGCEVLDPVYGKEIVPSTLKVCKSFM